MSILDKLVTMHSYRICKFLVKCECCVVASNCFCCLKIFAFDEVLLMEHSSIPNFFWLEAELKITFSNTETDCQAITLWKKSYNNSLRIW